MTEERRFDVLIHPPAFYDLSVPRNLSSKAEMRELAAAGIEGLRSCQCELAQKAVLPGFTRGLQHQVHLYGL